MPEMNEKRCRLLIERAIGTFDLGLAGLRVLTEAATGYYKLTPLIAALAGAEHVYALAADSRYGGAGEIREETLRLAALWGVGDRVSVLLSREDPRIGMADVVTNLGFVRPLDADFLRRLKRGAVIPLMWETWEYRAEDLDLAECRRLDIPVLGTNEHHPDLRIFEYIGHVALKLLFVAEIEVFRSRVVVAGGGEFAEQTVAALSNAGAQVTHVDTVEPGALASAASKSALRQADAVVVVEHHSRRMLIGPGGDISVGELVELNPLAAVIHVCGGVDEAGLRGGGLDCYPGKFAPPGYMSVATDYVGPRSLIDLHTAGLKVGEEMARAMANCSKAFEAELAVLRKSLLAQGFIGYHSRAGEQG
jgi:hypothetical protein